MGISHFLTEGTDAVKLNCSFKHRFSDFIVNEIDQKGDVVWWQSENANLQHWKMSNFENTVPVQEEEKVEGAEPKEEPDVITLAEEHLSVIKELFTEEDYALFLTYMEELKSGVIEKSALLCLESNYADKEKRAKIHGYFKSDVKKYETDTVVDHANQMIRKIRLFLVAGMSNKNRKR